MKPKQQHKKAAKGPVSIDEQLQEEVNEDIHPLLRKITENLKTIGIVIGVIVLVAAAYSGYTSFKGHRLAKAQEELGQIMTQKDIEQVVQDLEGFVEKAPSTMRQGVRLELARLAMQAKDYDLAAQTWKGIAAQAQDSPLHTVAKLGQAKALCLGDSPKAGLDIFEDLRSKAPKGYNQFLLTELGACAETAGELDKAIDAYQALLKTQKPGSQKFLQYKIGRLQKTIPQAS